MLDATLLRLYHYHDSDDNDDDDAFDGGDDDDDVDDDDYDDGDGFGVGIYDGVNSNATNSEMISYCHLLPLVLLWAEVPVMGCNCTSNI